jgi:hypothetical protein
MTCILSGHIYVRCVLPVHWFNVDWQIHALYNSWWHTLSLHFTRHCLVMTSINVDSSASIFKSLVAADCLIAHHGHNSWPLTPSPPLASTDWRLLWLVQLASCSLAADCIGNTSSMVSLLLHLCMCYRGRVFTKPFPSSGHLSRFCYPSFYQACHNI